MSDSLLAGSAGDHTSGWSQCWHALATHRNPAYDAPLPAPTSSSPCRAHPLAGGEAMRPAPARCAVRVLCLTTVLMLSACQPRATPPMPLEATACGGRFEATVRQGPSAGLTFVGQLEVRVEPSGQ